MVRPLIGITCSFESAVTGAHPARTYLNSAYSDAILAAGGLPYPIPVPLRPETELLDELLARCGGLLFTGGPDIDPAHYGQTRHPRTQVMDDRRSAFELAFFRCADRAALPTLSICLGCQVTNVCRGGHLVQHVDDLPRAPRVEHYREDHQSAFHAVRIEPDSLLARIVGRTALDVNSRHHQVVDGRSLGTELRPVAFAPDGVVEAVEDRTRPFFLAVQWHPEDLIDRPEHLRLFEALVAAAGQRNVVSSSSSI